MAGVRDGELETMSGWPAGIDNLSRESDLVRDDKGKQVIALRVAENADIDRSGKPRRREGVTSYIPGSRTHSLWRKGQWPFALLVINGVLTGMSIGGETFTVLEGLEPILPVSYELVGERVFWSNGSERGVVQIDGSASPWGCPTPYGNPMLSENVGVGGLISLERSRYQVAITWQLATGEESGAVLAGLVEIDDGSGIILSNIPTPDDPAVATVRVYVSPADGDVLYHAQDLAPGLPVATIVTGRRGKPLDTQFLDRMPVGHIVRWYNGRLFVADGGYLRWSEALRYGLTHPVNNRIGFGDFLDMIEPVQPGSEGAGMFVASGKRTYWLSGADPATMSQVIVYPHGVVPGTSIMLPASVFGLETNGEVAYWMATNGMAVVGLPGGQIMVLRENQTEAPQAESGASMFRERNGIRHVVTALSGTAPRGMAVTDSAVITVERYDET